MAENALSNIRSGLDVKQLLSEAKNRWLRPAEVHEILRNYEKFHIHPEAPSKPVSGSVFLFDRKVLRYFRKDGHSWRKKKDGKTIKEAHEKLKVGSVDMLNCYYAHGEDNEYFQRRSYWLLEQDLMHVVFVHYLEVKGNRISSISSSGRVISSSENNSSLSSSFCETSPTSTLSSTYEDAESDSPLTGDVHSTRSRSCTQILNPGNQNVSTLSYVPLTRGRRNIDFGGRSLISGVQETGEQEVLRSPTTGEAAYKQDAGCALPLLDEFQVPNNVYSGQLHNAKPFYAYPEQEEQSATRNEEYSFPIKRPLGTLHSGESLKKVDSFSRWIAKELADELEIQSSNGISWSMTGSEYDSNMSAQLQVDTQPTNTSISLDQIFSIMDFSPSWAYTNLETKVLITGRFLKSEEEISKCRWSIMFGGLEVPAEVLADRVLCCRAPLHGPGVVPFYVTCSNRSACSEIREFEYRFEPDGNIYVNGDSAVVMHLYQRFETLLSLEPTGSPVSSGRDDYEKQGVVNKIISLIEEDNNREANLISESNTSSGKVIGELLLEKQLKEKYYSWILQRVSSDGNGVNIIDKQGLSVLHLAAGLGFNWAFQPIIVSGVSIDFRDVNGWTALHWAAFYGREETVAALVSLGASPGALTDPSAEYPQGRTPSELAYSSGHKGISGFLGETFLTAHLLTLRITDGGTPEEAIHNVTECLTVPTTVEDAPDTLSLKDSITAVCNATQAAARIHQFFRIRSFQRKQLLIEERESDELVGSDDRAISLVTAKASRLGRSDGLVNTAALQIQKKYRGWKKWKEFLMIRQKIVRIQAHVRGHQVRKKYKPVIWSVGILEKVILRWRRKGTGLRGFRSDGAQQKPDRQETLPPAEDDYDYLKEGRKQTEERLDKALSRVRSMARYPEARDQYRRLLTAAEGFRENKDASDAIPDNMEDLIYTGDDLIDVSSLLDDDTFMSLAF